MSYIYIYIYIYISAGERPQAARLLRSWVRIPPGAWIFVCCECRVLSGRGLCEELITRRGVLPTVLRRCVWSRNIKNGCSIHIYIYDISHLRVNNTAFRTVMKIIPSSLPEKETWKNNINGERKQTTFWKRNPYFRITAVELILINHHANN